MLKQIGLSVLAMLLMSCVSMPKVDVLIVNGEVFDGSEQNAKSVDIGLCGELICVISPAGQTRYAARQVIDATGLVVSPGFIDPHTHSLADLQSDDNNANLNYLYQGVTTVVSGNDGGGPAVIEDALAKLNSSGIGTNLALYAGHGKIRQKVMGKAQRLPTKNELEQMKNLLAEAMQSGALGLSSGLYYVPGSFANTEEVIELAKVAAQSKGIYDTHLRDESTFNIGFLAALDEAISIAEQASIHLHLAHIKALGVDVWGQSEQAINKIEQAQNRGISISADQYPWLASGTNIHSAVVPKWLMADSESAFLTRLDEPALQGRIRSEIADNIRRRGGASKLLITASPEHHWVGNTLADLSTSWQLDPVDSVLKMVRKGRHRVASYNMNPQDVERFMSQSWVVTSSDGTDGHPRKYASFPKKYREYVKDKKLLTLAQFVHRSSGKTAQLLSLNDRGRIAKGLKADIVIFDPKHFQDQATFSQWNALSSGMEFVWVNGVLVIEKQKFTGALAGRFVIPVH